MAPLHYAARSNHVEIVKMLLKANADVEVKGSEKIQKITPLVCAAKFNAIEACRVLIQNGANVNVKDCYGQTGLHHTTRRTHHKIVELLLTEGKMDVNVVDVDKTTALHMAAQVGDHLSAELLLFHGIDIEAQDNDGFTAFHIAAREGNTKVLKTLLDTARSCKMNTTSLLDIPDHYGNTCLHLAVKFGHCPATKLCIDYGASPCCWQASLQTPLHLAAVSGNLCILKMLMANKHSDIHIEDGDGMTPILRSSLEGHTDIMEYLLDEGAQLNSPPGSGSPSPLMCAVERGQHKAIEFLLSRGALIDLVDNQWRNCLHIASACADPETVQILLQNGAKSLVNSKDSYGKTPLHYVAVRCKHAAQIVSLLHAAGADFSACDNNEQIPLHYAAMSGIVVSIRALLEASPCTVNHPDNRSQTPFHLAASNGRSEACRFLLQKGAEIDYRDDLRLTPLFHAVKSKCPLSTKVLLEFGADINAVDKHRKTPIILAALEGNVDVFKTLLQFGADLTSVCVHGYSALDTALQNNQLNICNEIIKHDRWQDVLLNTKLNKVTPMKEIIEKFPCLAKAVLDKCLTESMCVDTDINYSVEYDFQFLCPHPDRERDKEGKRYFGPKVMLDNGREELLRHPVTKALMGTKWRKVGVNFFYLGALVYAIFVGIFSHYMYVMHVYESARRKSGKNETIDNNGTWIQCIQSYEICIAVFSIANLLYECYQLYTERCKYFELTNMLQVSTFVSSLIAVYPMNGDQYLDPCISWNAGAIGVMLSYLTMLQFIQCLFYSGIYVTMLFEVLKSLLKVFAVFFPLMGGFAMVLMLVMADRAPFTDFRESLTKVFAMTIGEIEYSRYFVDEGRLLKGTEENLAMFVFILFCLLMPIALMNLLIGLAVGDIDSVQNHAELKMMATEIEAVFDFEEKIPLVLRRRFHKSKLVIFPNRRGFNKVVQTCFGWISSIRDLVEIRNGRKADTNNEVTRDEINEIQESLNLHSDRMFIVLEELKQQRLMLESIVSAVHAPHIPHPEDRGHEEENHDEGILGKL
ncbi:transient receptor potential cation channel subfamily A member 1-like isoform X2 [Actinia tenebrosa]|nr:transient receptor potential cation channel subfamily A member 1-like isoform X2 [Actinia tenebrosa]